MDFLRRTFDTDGFVPQWYCGDWSAGYGWLHILSDLGIWSAYVAIPVVLAYFALRRKDLPFHSVFWLFFACILACGSTHLMEAFVFWWPAHRLAALIKLATAVISWATVAALIQIAPRVLSLRGPSQLEREVKARMRELAHVVDTLQSEIQERQRIEEELRHQKTWLQVTLASIGDAVITTDDQGRVTFLNGQAEHLTGWTLDEARERPLKEVFSIFQEDTHAEAESPVEEVLREGKIVGLANHTRLRSRGGGDRPIDDSAAPIQDASGRTAGVVLVFRDISERRAAEAARQELAALVESSSDAIIAQNMQGDITSWNSGAEHLYGFRASEMVGRPISQLVPPGLRGEMQTLLERTRRGELTDHLDTVRLRKDGTPVDVSMRLSPIRNPGGVVIGTSAISRDITERKRADESLRESDRRRTEAVLLLESLLANAPIGFAYFDREHRYVRINQFMADIDGVSIANHLWRRLADVLPEQARAVDPVLQRVFATGQAVRNFEISGETPAQPGKRRSWLAGFYPVRSPDDQITWVGAVLIEITDRKTAEHALRESESRFRGVVESNMIGIGFWESNGQVTDANESLLNILNYTRDELRKGEVPWNELTPVEFRAADRQAFQQIMQTGRCAPYEKVYRRQGGQEVPVLIGGGRFEGIADRGAFFVLDISDRKRIEGDFKFLADASATLGSLVDSESALQRVATLAVPSFADWCGIDMLDAHGELRRLATSHQDARKVELVNEIRQHYPPYFDALGAGTRVLSEGKSLLVTLVAPGDLREHTEDKEHLRMLEELHVESFIAVPLEVHDRVLGVLSFATAESGRRFTRHELTLAEDLAHRAAVSIDNSRLYAEIRDKDRRKDEFLAMLAHELRNPLAPIRNALALLQHPDTDAKAAQATRDIMERQVEHLARLVDDLLDVSRITRGKIELRKSRVLLESIITRAIETARPLIELNCHRLHVEQPKQRAYIEADEIRLAQIVSNLLNNAAKYTKCEGDIWLTVEAVADGLTIRVRDNGIGIEPQLLPRVFDLFTQADRSIERSQGGLGIGLTLVRNLVELHGGTVTAFSAGLDQGSEFVVKLPLELHCGPPAPRAFSPQAVRPLKVLVVEDNVGAAKILATLLSRFWKHEVQLVFDGLSVLEHALAFLPDLILMDIGLPGISGYEAARRLRERPEFAETLLVALTGYGQDQDRRRSMEVGFDEHLVKPPSVDTLQRLFTHPKLG